MRTNNLKKILGGIIIGIGIINIFGCSEDEKKTNDNVVINDNDGSVSTENNINEGSIDENINIEDNINDDEKDDSKENISGVKEQSEEFTIYTMDVNTDEKVIVKNIELSKSLSLEEKLVNLASDMSKEIFSNLPINLVEIKEVDGKKVAVFNFDEVGENADKETLFQDYKGKSWFQYFQGSAGGRVTEYTLLETLLQRNYKGQWIDGIEFTYKNGNMDFQHSPKLSEIVYR